MKLLVKTSEIYNVNYKDSYSYKIVDYVGIDAIPSILVEGKWIKGYLTEQLLSYIILSEIKEKHEID
ncbi:MAG: hypothetical protein K9N07_10595 [Candidatus Cloacimonetes bacterium]|nr:hypothetical protein [Candidatus Cloacimonadota bacterium]MCF8262296.1 hypothetical protein [Melioribacteraceae bacterium]